MSMISELVDRLRVEAKSMGTYGTDYMATLLMRSADTIEMLSEKARESDEPQTDNGIGCSRCEGRFDCYDRDMPHAVRCNNYGKITDEPQTDSSWK